MKRRDGDYETYCPKAFALIGDVHDTLRDRCIVIEMKRREPARRFIYAAAKEEGDALREAINAAVTSKAEEITEALRSFEGLSFLTDRDDETWTPLFVLCRLICPDRIDELTRAAADLSAAKTAKAKRYSELGEEEDRAEEEEYAVRLLQDMLHVIGDQKQITTQEAITKLREIPTSPWRRFRGVLTGRWARGLRTKSPMSSRLAANSWGTKLPKTHSPRDTGKGNRSTVQISYYDVCGVRGQVKRRTGCRRFVGGAVRAACSLTSAEFQRRERTSLTLGQLASLEYPQC